MGYYFELGLTWLVIITGIVAIIDILVFAPKRIAKFHRLVEGDMYINPPAVSGKNRADRIIKTLLLSCWALIKLAIALFFWKKEWYFKHYQKKKQRSASAELLQLKDKLDPPLIIEYCKSFFPVLFLVLIIRSFLFSPYIIPSGSLEPTLLPGDLVLANKFSYGLRLPITHAKLSSGDPQLGDIFIFRFPADTTIDYIKRVVGVPGDTISYVNKVLTINGKEQKQLSLGKAMDEYFGKQVSVQVKQEDLNGIKHNIYINPAVPAYDFVNIKIPPGYYFAMGDNRDDSADSRFWGLVPEENIIGKASIIWLSKTPGELQIRWNRLGEIH